MSDKQVWRSIWRPVPGYSRYEFDQSLTVRDRYSGRIMSGRHPYCVKLTRDDGKPGWINYTTLRRVIADETLSKDEWRSFGRYRMNKDGRLMNAYGSVSRPYETRSRARYPFDGGKKGFQTIYRLLWGTKFKPS